MFHAELGTQSFRVRGGYVVSITAHATTKNFGIDPCPARFCVFQILKDHRCTAFAEHKAIPVLVIGP